MSKKNRIIKLITIILIAVYILLISPNIFAADLKFNCFDKEFTVKGAGEYDEYRLSYDLCRNSIAYMDTIKDSKNNKKWVVGREITTPSGLGGSDGYYIMRRRKRLGSRLCL